MLKEAEREQGWDLNPGPSDLSAHSPDCPMPGSWARIPQGRKPFSAEPPNPLPIENHSRASQAAPDYHTGACPPWVSRDSPYSHIPRLSNDQQRLRVPRQPCRYHSPQRPRSSCPCRSCGFSGAPRPQGTPAGVAARCPGGHPPFLGPAVAPETQNTRKRFYWALPFSRRICHTTRVHSRPKRTKKKIKALKTTPLHSCLPQLWEVIGKTEFGSASTT